MVKKSGRKSAGGGGHVVSEMGDGPVRGTLQHGLENVAAIAAPCQPFQLEVPRL